MMLARLISKRRRGVRRALKMKTSSLCSMENKVEGYCPPGKQPETQVFRSIQDGFEGGGGVPARAKFEWRSCIVEMFCREENKKAE